jgi:hypothetical protein
MAYAVNINFGEIDDVENLTVSYMDDITLGAHQEFNDWWEENYGTVCDDYDPYRFVEDFRSSMQYYDLIDSYYPIIDVLHILQEKLDEETTNLITKYVSSVALFRVHSLDVDGIALLGCGMDMSEYIELAYYICDGTSPIQAHQIMSLPAKQKDLLLWFREVRATKPINGRVTRYEMHRYLDSK